MTRPPLSTAQLAQVASWYYEDNLGLSDIAKRLDRSVSMVSRMLTAARETGLVEIRIKHQHCADEALGKHLMCALGVRQAHVLAGAAMQGPQRDFGRFGAFGAQAISESLHQASVVGVSWGGHVHAIVSALADGAHGTGTGTGTVVQISGASDASEVELDGAEVAHLLAGRLGYATRILPAPLIVATEAVARSLRGAPPVRDAMALARHAEVALIGVGTPDNAAASLRRAGYVTRQDAQRLTRRGAVGDIAGYHVDKNGKLLEDPLNRRVVGLGLGALRRVPTVIVAATGAEKVEPILAAVAAQIADILITDTPTAEHLLRTSRLQRPKEL